MLYNSLVNLSQKCTQPQKNCNKRFFDGFVFYCMSFVTLQKFTKIWPWEKVKFMSNPKWRKFTMKCLNNQYISFLGHFLAFKWHVNIDNNIMYIILHALLPYLLVFCIYSLIMSSNMDNITRNKVKDHNILYIMVCFCHIVQSLSTNIIHASS